MTVGSQVFRNLANGLRHVDQFGMQVEHHRRLVGSTVHTHAQLRRRRCATLIGWLRRMGQEGLEAELQPQFAVGHGHERTVSAVAVQEHEFASTRGGDTPPDVFENRQHGSRRHPNGAGVPGVLVALRVGQRRQQPRVDPGVHGTRHGGFGHCRGNGQVGDQREMRAVLFDRAERLDDDRLLGQRRGDLRATKMRDVTRHASTLLRQPCRHERLGGA